MKEIRRYLDLARGQLDLIENSFQLIGDQIVTMQSPQELSGSWTICSLASNPSSRAPPTPSGCSNALGITA